MKNDEELPGMLAVAKGIAEQRFPHTMDAAVWAAEFVKLHPDADEGMMLGWFANAIMAGYDTACARSAIAHFTTPRPLSYEVASVLTEYDGIVNGRLDPRDAEADFVMRGSDWRVIRDFFAKLRPGGAPTEIVNPPRPA